MVLKLYKRNIIDEITKYLFTDDVVVLHGARQVGKTSILYWFKDFLRGKNKIVHYIDLEDSRFVSILNRGPDDFINYLKEEGVYTMRAELKSFGDDIVKEIDPDLTFEWFGFNSEQDKIRRENNLTDLKGGKITIRDQHTLVDVPEDYVSRVLGQTGSYNFREHQNVTIERASV